MNDQSTPVTSGASVTPTTIANQPIQTGGNFSGNKEMAPIGGIADHHEGLIDVTGQEMELPKEVHNAGVRMQPTVVSIPAHVTKLGVQPAGANIPAQTVSSVVLPLSDEQIAIGLKEGITNSVRWLAEWCVRRLKHVHLTIKNVHGSFTRVSE